MMDYHASNPSPPRHTQGLQTFFQLVTQAEAQGSVPQLPAELRNLDQLRVLLDALPDYHSEAEQPSYVLAIPCRPVILGLSSVLPGLPFLSKLNWGSLMTYCAGEGAPR